METAAKGSRQARRVRARDAATLIVLRRDADAMRLLMGWRSARHVFHPGAIVFPGGCVDAADAGAPAADELHPDVDAKLRVAASSAPSRRLALAAIRETFEEVGILIGAPGDAAARPILPKLSALRFVGRAITPPGRERRYDARFFAVFADAIAMQVPPPEDELVSPVWLTFDEARSHPLLAITRMILDQLGDRLAKDPTLAPGAPVPFHFMTRGKRRQTWI